MFKANQTQHINQSGRFTACFWLLMTSATGVSCSNVNSIAWFCLKEYAEFQYRRRHRQQRRGDMSSVRSNTPDPDDLSDSTLGSALIFLFPFVMFNVKNQQRIALSY